QAEELQKKLEAARANLSAELGETRKRPMSPSMECPPAKKGKLPEGDASNMLTLSSFSKEDGPVLGHPNQSEAATASLLLGGQVSELAGLLSELLAHPNAHAPKARAPAVASVSSAGITDPVPSQPLGLSMAPVAPTSSLPPPGNPSDAVHSKFKLDVLKEDFMHVLNQHIADRKLITIGHDNINSEEVKDTEEKEEGSGQGCNEVGKEKGRKARNLGKNEMKGKEKAVETAVEKAGIMLKHNITQVDAGKEENLLKAIRAFLDHGKATSPTLRGMV
ncbi:hypothetical protein DXG03_001010, partial [Asterophora parasitica]